MVRVGSSSSKQSGRRPADLKRPLRAAACLILTSLVILICSYALLLGGATAGSSPSGVAAAGPDGGGGGGGPPPPPRSRRGSISGRVSGSVGGGAVDPSPVGGGAVPSQPTVGYAVSITGCGTDPLTDGAAVLAHSIRLSSSATPSSGSRYGYKMYAIIHPAAESCAPLADLRALGYEIMVRDVPVPISEIRGKHLRERVSDNGCCGEKEFVKLHAYRLVGHPVVVHLDLDTLVLRPLDELFDTVVLGLDAAAASSAASIPTHADKPLPNGQVDAFFTRDYNMVRPGREHVGVQGGFLVLRPSLDAYQNFVDIIRKGDFRANGGWGGKGYGPFYGSMTFQGIIPYYYDELHPGTAVELNRCVYNQMCDNPRDQKTVNDVVSGRCRDGRSDCEDCRSRPLDDVRTAHFTLCQKPWWCLPQGGDRIQERLCRKLHGEWFRIRADLESSWGRSREGEGTYQKEHFRGFCKKHRGYMPIEVPSSLDGKSFASEAQSQLRHSSANGKDWNGRQGLRLNAD